MAVQFRAKGKEFKAQAFLFDKDGTLITYDHWFSVMKERARRLVRGLGLSEEEAQALGNFMGVERGRPGNWGIIPLPRPEAEAATAQFLARLLKQDLSRMEEVVREVFTQVDMEFPFERHIRPTPGSAELLVNIKHARGKVGVVTHDIASAAWKHVRALGWDDLVDVVVGLDVCPVKKPAAESVHYASKLLGAKPSQVVMVGDTAWDLQAGRAAGCAGSLGVLTGLGTEEELAPWADVLLRNLRELLIGK